MSIRTSHLPHIAALVVFSFCLPVCLPTPVRAQELSARPSLTVADFATDRTGWMPPPHLGETLAELLTDRLVTAGPFRMMDRGWLVTAPHGNRDIPFDVLQERAASAGVDYLVAGSVTRLSNEKRSSTGGGILPMPLIGGIVRKHKTEQVIGLTIRVISVRTGEVVATATAESGASHDQTSGGGLAMVGHVPLIGAKGSTVTGLQDGLLDKAVQQAITLAAERLVAAAPRIVQAH
jgi:curli biogenesis system outer membrane secretion channel CsgG